MMIRRWVSLYALVLAACHGGSTVETAPLPANEWPSLVSQASQEANAGRYGVADKLLTDFTARYPASSEAGESMYWRAIYKLDPSNPNSSARDAGLLLDTYLSNGSVPHRAEATTLRRLASVLEGRSNAAPAQASARPAPTEPSTATDKLKDDEIARLKDELAKANAELERIKKRLAQPTKP
jgi:hypothetical protein